MSYRPAAYLFSAAALLLSAGLAHAGGLQLPTRGVRPTARAGAFVAGADDLGALWFNPAGLANLLGGKKRSALVDFGYVSQATSYTRIDSGNNSHPTVESSAPGLPIPTLAVGLDVADRATVAAGIFAPYAALSKYDSDGPQRYSLVDLSESVLVIQEVAVGYKVSDTIRIGIGVQNMVFHLASSLVFSGCPGETVCQPENPLYDSESKVTQTSYFNPSAVFGAQVDIGREATFGLAFQLPFFVSGQGTMQTRLPSADFYNGVSIVGERADVSFTLPTMMRAGLEVRPHRRWRAEMAANLEFWSMHEEFLIEPRNVRLEDVPGLGTYEIGPISIPRNFEDTFSLSLGVEGQLSDKQPLTVLFGYAFETAASPDAFQSVMTVDGNRNLFSGGLGWNTGPMQFNATVAYVAVSDRHVDPAVGRAPQLSPLRESPDVEPLDVWVNWGDYTSSWLVLGVGLSTAF